MPYPGLQHPEPMLLRQAMIDPCLCSTHSNTVLAQSCGVFGYWCTQGLSEPSECLWRVRDLILNVILPLLLSFWGFSFALGCGVSFFGGIQHSPDDDCSAVSCNFGLLTREDEHTSFYSTILFHPGLKLSIQKMIMASNCISSWQIDVETMETVADFIFQIGRASCRERV